MLKPFGLSIFFYRTKTILSTKNIRKYTHEYATSISQNTHICCAKYSHSNTKYIATDLQQHNIQKTKTILLQCKNLLFARQKGGFYTPKTPFLFSEYVTATEQTSYTQFFITHCIFKKWVANTHEIGCEHSVGVGDRFIVPVSLHNQICISISPNTCIHFNIYAFPHY